MPKLEPPGAVFWEIDLKGQFEIGLVRQIAIGEQQHLVEGFSAAECLGETERFLDVARHIFHGERVECIAQFAMVVREGREPMRGFSEGDETEFLVRQQSINAFAQSPLHFVEPCSAASVIQRAHARGDIDEHRQTVSTRRFAPEKRLHRREHEQSEDEDLQ